MGNSEGTKVVTWLMVRDTTPMLLLVLSPGLEGIGKVVRRCQECEFGLVPKTDGNLKYSENGG